jgi:hypothetical protein
MGLLFGAVAQSTDSNPSFGQGVRGYVHYAGTAYRDYVIGDYVGPEDLTGAVAEPGPRASGAAPEISRVLMK